MLRALPLAGAALRNADLRYANLEGAGLQNGDLSGADLQWANAKGANLEGCNLAYVKAINADLTGARMHGACLDEACLIDAQLSHADMQHVRARRASFLGASLLRADLRRADLEGAYLTTADIRFARLADANLRHAQLRNAHLRGAELDGADLAGADLRGAQQVAPLALRQARHWRKAQRDGSALRRAAETVTAPIALAGVALWRGPRWIARRIGAGLAWMGSGVARGARGLARALLAVVKAPFLAAAWLGARTAVAARVAGRGLARALLAAIEAPFLAAAWLGARAAVAARGAGRGLARAVAGAAGALIAAARWLGPRAAAALRMLARAAARAAAVAAVRPLVTALWLGSWALAGGVLLLRGLARAQVAGVTAAAALYPWLRELPDLLGRGARRGWHRFRLARSRAAHARLAMRGPSRALAHHRPASPAEPVWQRPAAMLPRAGMALAEAGGSAVGWLAAVLEPRRPGTLASVGASLAMAAAVALLSLGEAPSESRADSAPAAAGTERLMPRTVAAQAAQPAAPAGGGPGVGVAGEGTAVPSSADRADAGPGDGLEVRTIQAAFVTVRNSNVRAGPSISTRRVGYLPQGTRVDVAGKVPRKQWYRVILADEKIGYVYMPLLRQLSDAGDTLADARGKPVLRPVGEAR